MRTTKTPACRIVLATCASLLALSASATSPVTTPAGPAGMQPALRNEKISIPVDVFYSKGQALQLAFVPRISAGRMQVELLPDAGLGVQSGAETMVLASVNAKAIYRRQVNLKSMANAQGRLRALVTLELGDSRFAGIFTVPMSNIANKAEPTKRRRQPAL